MASRTLLVSGFTAFGPHEDNPAARIAAAVDGLRLPGVVVAGVTLPVVWRDAFPTLQRAVEACAPAALLMLGVADRPDVCFEVLARNVQGARVDASGALPEGAVVDAAGPGLLPGRLPWSRLSAAPLPVRYSNDAGDYLCNHLLYRAMASLPHVPVRGFVHIPPLPETGLATARPWSTLQAAGLCLVRSLAAAL